MAACRKSALEYSLCYAVPVEVIVLQLISVSGHRRLLRNDAVVVIGYLSATVGVYSGMLVGEQLYLLLDNT